MGEPYLRIQLVGHEFVSAFKNEKKEKDKHPDFRGDGVAVWIKEKKDKLEKPEVVRVAKQAKLD